MLAGRHQLDAVELRAVAGTVELPRYFAEHFGTPAALARAVSALPLRVSALNTSWRLLDGGSAERAAFIEFVPWAEALGARYLRVFDGGNKLETSDVARAVEAVSWWRGQRARHNWKTDIMVETHDTLITAAAIVPFIAAVPHVAILWDAHHTWRKGGEDPLKTWRAVGSHVVHVHIKDSVPIPRARHPFTYVLPGDGDFPAALLLAELRTDGFGGCVSLEWEKMWHPYLPSLDEALTVAAIRQWW